jgi:hypothetical protein
MKKYTLFWRTGDREIVKGQDIADAVRRAGYGGGAMSALDFWSHGDDRSYAWNSEVRKWEKI